MSHHQPKLIAVGWLAAWLAIQLFATAVAAEASWWKIALRGASKGKAAAVAARQAARTTAVESGAARELAERAGAPQIPYRRGVSPRGQFNSRVEPSSQNQAFDRARFPPNDGFRGPMPRPRTTLPKGTVIDRFGSTRGTFAAPAGTPTPARALPPATQPRPFTAYVVEKPIPKVKAGPAAANYGQPGGGTQYKLPSTVEHLHQNGFLRQMEPKDRGFAKLNFRAQATDRKP